MGWPHHIPGGPALGDDKTGDLDPQLECSCWPEPWPVLSSCHILQKGTNREIRSTEHEDLTGLQGLGGIKEVSSFPSATPHTSCYGGHEVGGRSKDS